MRSEMKGIKEMMKGKNKELREELGKEKEQIMLEILGRLGVRAEEGGPSGKESDFASLKTSIPKADKKETGTRRKEKKQNKQKERKTMDEVSEDVESEGKVDTNFERKVVKKKGNKRMKVGKK